MSRLGPDQCEVEEWSEVSDVVVVAVIVVVQTFECLDGFVEGRV